MLQGSFVFGCVRLPERLRKVAAGLLGGVSFDYCFDGLLWPFGLLIGWAWVSGLIRVSTSNNTSYIHTNKFILIILSKFFALTNTYLRMIGRCGISRHRHEPIA